MNITTTIESYTMKVRRRELRVALREIPATKKDRNPRIYKSLKAIKIKE